MTTVKIGIAGHKGGISKSTVAMNLSAGLARHGYRVLLLEADGQGNASMCVGIEPHDGFYHLVMEDAEWDDILVPVPEGFYGEGELYLVSAWSGQQIVEKHPDAPSLIYHRLGELDSIFDFVVADTSPGMTNVHTGLYYAMDYVILPTLCEFSAIKSLGTTLGHLESAREQIENDESGLSVAEVLAIVPNRFFASENVQRENLGWIKGRYSQEFRILPQISNGTVWGKCANRLCSIYTYTPESSYERNQLRDAQREFDPVVQVALEAMEKATNEQ